MYTKLLVVVNESDIVNASIGTIVIVLNGRKVGIKSSTGEMIWFAVLPKVEQTDDIEKTVETSPTVS